jgi:hypothetical protein
MNRFQSQITYALLIMVTGITVIVNSYSPTRPAHYAVAVIVFIASMLAFATAAKARNTEIPLPYNALQGVGMLLYALAIFIYGYTLQHFIAVTMVFMLYFGITEIFFGLELMNYRPIVTMSLITFKMITGLAMSVLFVIIVVLDSLSVSSAFLFTGILIAVKGFNFIWFAALTRKLREPFEQ